MPPKWRQEKYEGATNSHEVPPNVALTLWACQNFVPAKDGEMDFDLKSLYHTMATIMNQFSIQEYNYDGSIKRITVTCSLPVMPYSDILYKMRDSDSHLILLYNRLSYAVKNLKEAVELSSDHEAGLCVQRVLGDDFSVPEKAARVSSYIGPIEHNFGMCVRKSMVKHS